MDLVIATFIFSIALTFFYFYTLNDRNSPKETIESLALQGKSISDSLLSAGFPEDWTESNVVEIGIETSGKINETKLEQFYNLTQNDYEKTKRLFNIKSDYIVFFDKEIDFGFVKADSIGKPGSNRTNIKPKNLIKVERIVIYRDLPAKMTIYVFEE